MSPWLMSIALSSVLVAQVDKQAETGESSPKIQAAIKDLGSRDFATRKEASRVLWRQGLAAEPALRKAAKSSNGETRLRARTILRDFEYGILPGVDAATTALIRGFRDGEPTQRQVSYQQLLAKEKFTTIERLLRLEKRPEVRRTLLTQLVQHPKAVAKFVDLGRIETLIETVAADQDENWRRTVTIQLMFSPKVLEYHAEQKQLAKILKLIQNEKEVNTRRQMLNSLFNSPTTAALIIEKKQLAFLLTALKAESDKQIRGQLLSTMVSNGAAAQKVVENGELGEIMKFADEHIAEDVRAQLLQRLLQSPAIAQALLKEGGVDRLIELVSREKDPATRGQLMGVAVVSSAVRSNLRGKALAELIVKIAQQEKEAAGRREFLQAFLGSNNVTYYLSSGDSLQSVWQLVRNEDDTAWQARMIALLLRSHRAHRLLADKEDANWVLQLVQDEAAAPAREELLGFLLANQQTVNALIGQGHFDTMLALAKGQPDRSRGRILSSLIASHPVAQYLVAKNNLNLLVVLAKEESDAATRQALLQGVFRNYTAMPQLLKAGHYDTFRKLIDQDEDPSRRAALFGDFINGNTVLDEIARREDVDLLLEFATTEHEGGRQQFRTRMFQNQRAITMLLEKGHSEELIAIAKEDEGAFLDKLLVVPKVIEHLAAKKQFAALLEAAMKRGDNSRRQMLQRIFYNQGAVKAIIAAGQFDGVFRLIKAEPDPNWRASLLSPALSSTDVLAYFAKHDKLGEVFGLISGEPEPNARNRMLSYLVNRSDSVALLVDNGKLDSLLDLVKRHAQGRSRGASLARVLTNTKTLQRLKEDGRVALLLSFAKPSSENDEAAQAYLSTLLMNDKAITLLIGDQHFETVLALAKEQPDAQRGQILSRLIASQSVAQHLQASGRLDRLVGLVQEESHEATRHVLLLGVFGNNTAMPQLMKAGHYPTFLKLIERDKDSVRKATLFGAFLSGNSVVQQVASRGDLDLLLKYAETENEAARKQFLPRLFGNQQAISLLVEKGHYEKLAAIAKENNGAFLAQLLVVPKVIQHLAASKQFDVVFKFATEQADENTRRNLLRSILYNGEVVKTLLASDQFDVVLRLVKAEREPNWRNSLLSPALNSPDVIRYFAKGDKLDLLFELIESASDSNSRNQILSYLVGRSDTIAILVESGHLDKVVEFIKTKAEGRSKGDLLGRLLTDSTTLEWLKTKKRTDLLLSAAIAKDENDEATSSYLTRLFSYSNAVEPLIASGHFDKLLSLAKQQPDRSRGPVLGGFLANQAVAQHLSKAQDLELLLTLAKEESHEPARTECLRGLFRNYSAMPALLKAGHYATFRKLVEGIDDLSQRAALFGDFLNGQNVLAEVAKQGDVEVLLNYAAAEDAEARNQFLTRMFRNRNAIALLVEKGHYDKLATIAKQDNASFMDELLAVPQVIDHLTATKQFDVLMAFVSKDSDANTRRRMLQALFSNSASLKSLLKSGHFDELFRVARAEGEAGYRGSLLSYALGSPDVIRHFGNTKQLKVVAATLADEPEANIRNNVVSSLMRSETIQIFVEQGALDQILSVIVRFAPESSRGGYVGRVLTENKTIEKLKAEKQLGVLLSTLKDLDGDVAQAYAGSLFASRAALAALLEVGRYDELFQTATSEVISANPFEMRARRLSQLYANDKAVTQLLQSRQLPLLLRFATEAAGFNDRRIYVTTLSGNEQFVKALIEQKLFGDLVEVCRAEPEANRRNQLLTTLLLSPLAIDQLAGSEQLQEVVKLAANEPDADVHGRFLSSLFRRSDAIQILMEKGEFEPLLESVERNLNPSTRKELVSRLVSNSKTITQLAKIGKAGILTKLITSEPDTKQRGYLIQRFVYNREAMRALVEAGQLQVMLKHIAETPNDSMRRSMLGSAFASPATLDHLSKNGELDVVFQTVEKESDEGLRRRCLQAFLYDETGRRILGEGEIAEQFVALLKQSEERSRRGYVTNFLRNSVVRQKWVAIGLIEKLKEVAALEQDQASRESNMRQILYTPSGLLGHLLHQGQVQEAEQLVRQKSTDHGMLLLATYLLIEGRLDEEIETVQQRFESDQRPDGARLLTYLHRANGDLSAAQEMAEKAGDPRLLRPLLVERRAWNAAAALQAESLYPPPIAVSKKRIDEQLQRVEQLGLLAACQRLGGQKAEFEQTIRQIHELAEEDKDNKTLGWNCAEALLLNDQVEAGLRLAARTNSLKAFNLFSVRHQYAEALALVGWTDDVAINRAWYDRLPAGGRNAGEISRNRFDSALRIARVLRLLGRHEDVESILQLLEAYALEIPTSGNSPRREDYWEQLSGGLYRMGLTERAFKIGARCVGPTTIFPHDVLTQLYPNAYWEARHWWTVLRTNAPKESPEQRLARLNGILRGPADEQREALDELVKQAIDYGGTIKDSTSTPYWYTIGMTCKRLGRQESARLCFENAMAYVPAAKELAHLSASQQRWEEAAVQYEKVWHLDRQQVGGLYLAGDALVRDGQEERGKQLKRQANGLALQPDVRHQLALDLHNRGLSEEAAEQWKLLLRTAPFETWYLNDAARRLGDHTLERDPSRTADYWQHYVLGDLRIEFSFNQDKSFLRLPLLIHKMRARAAVEIGDWKIAQHEAELAVQAIPGDTPLAEELVPLLNAASKTEHADALYGKIIQHYTAKTEAYAQSAFFHNNLAWVSARCHRQLELASKHATQAVELDPDNGSYVDTLAEVQFHLGDRDKAIQLSERAVKLRPSASLRRQLERFRNDPLPKP
jgi:tetratricopeptide (TPR) repeat protein